MSPPEIGWILKQNKILIKTDLKLEAATKRYGQIVARNLKDIADHICEKCPR